MFMVIILGYPITLLMHLFYLKTSARVSVQGVVSLGGHNALCRGFDFYKVKNKLLLLFFKQKREIRTFTLLIIFIVKSLQKEENSTNLLL